MASKFPPLSHYFPVRLNASLKSGQYQVLRKLGEGVTSATWLVLNGNHKSESVGINISSLLIQRGSSTEKYLAVKVLTLEATANHVAGDNIELEVLQRIMDQDDSEHLALLQDSFFEVGPRGQHLCIGMVLQSSSVATLRHTSPKKVLPPYMVRNIMHMALEALSQAHALSIVHTGKHDPPFHLATR